MEKVLLLFLKMKNWIDITVLALCILFCIRGLFHGFFKGIFNFLALFLGLSALIFIPSHFYENKNQIPAIQDYVIISLICFFVFFLTMRLCGNLLHQGTELLHVGWLNRLFGGALGLFKAIIFSTILLFILEIIPINQFEISKNTSKSIHIFRKYFPNPIKISLPNDSVKI
jgi:membrane protein required for colicin V production